MPESLDDFIRDSFATALAHGHIQAYYQPVIRSISRKLCSFEALARWVDPDRGLITPNHFIPALEDMRAIHLLDIEIIRQACARIRQSIDSGQVAIPISINLSRLDFVLCDIFDEINALVSSYHIAHDFLYIEITESLMAEQGGNMHGVIDRFRAAGFQIWMDDFGSGYSSLNVLKDFSFDEIKLDMTFLSSFDQRSQRIMTSVVQMAKEIDIHTLTEGVESEEQFQYLRDIGCEKVQGYYFGRPMPYDEALAHLESIGVEVELPIERAYYDGIGKVNLLSAVPFMSQEERDTLVTARQLNSIPLAIAEVRGDSFSILFYNSAFEETARGTGFVANIFAQETLRRAQPLNLLPARVINLMDSTRSGGEGRMHFISNDDYYEIQAKCVAQSHESYCVLFRMSNLSQASESHQREQLDDGLRQLYTLYERITLVDTSADAIMPLYVATRKDVVSGRTGLRRLHTEYAKRWIFPEDREAYLAFSDESTLDQRVNATGRLHITQLFRSYVRHGQYEWKSYTLLYLRPHTYVELIRNVHEEVLGIAERIELALLERERATVAPEAPGPTDALTDAQLWRSLVNSDIIRMFWKDNDRRFVGASKSFLEYYGFESLDVILGKNDEDLGWHVQPGPYMTNELSVLQEGITSSHEPGHCIRNGENRDIFASKAPVYDENGHIQGLVGFFLDKDLLLRNDPRHEETKRRDMLTGLLNSRGLHEEARLFRDSYFLRGNDFVRIGVEIDDVANLNSQYGFDFGDKAIAEFGRVLKQSFGQASAVARVSGQRFAIMRQVSGKDEALELLGQVKESAARVQRIDGVALTLYVSVGACLFSETEDLNEQAKKADVRLLADHGEHTSSAKLQARASEIFHLYDNLPIPYAVYQVLTDENERVYDAIVFYVNHAFEEGARLSSEDIVGKRTRKLFPSLEESWYELARRAAVEGDMIVDTMRYEPLGVDYAITASQVIHSGYCCFTYQMLER